MKRLFIIAILFIISFSIFAQSEAYIINKPVDEINGHDWMAMSFDEKLGVVYGWYMAYYAVMQSLVDEEIAELGRDLTEEELDAYTKKFRIDMHPADIGAELERFYSDESNRDVMLVWKIIDITGKDWWNKE